jgi:molecular chaperone DnaK (HSP70)
MRKLAALVFLAVVAVAVWAGAQWFVHRQDIKATVVFAKPQKLRPGDAVKENGREVGRVVSIASIDDRQAVTVRLNRRERRAIVTDSLFSVKDHAVVVDNTFAIGRPIDDGEILEARDDRFARWLARHGAAAKPYIDAFRARIDTLADHDFDEWTRRLPEWKKEGRVAFDRHVADAERRVAELQEELRKSNRAAEARKLKERFEQWLNETGR